MTKTTTIIDASITIVQDGDHGATFTEEDLRQLASALKEDFGVDDIVVKSAKTFVMNEEEK